MSTNSVVGLFNEKRGRYVHWDGYPTYMGNMLAAICKENGVDEAMEVITKKYTHWSCLDNGSPAENEPGRFKLIPHYGITYIDEEEGAWHSMEDSAFEWGYFLESNGDMHIFSYGKEVGVVNINDEVFKAKMEDIEFER